MSTVPLQRRTDTTYACPVIGRRELMRQQRGHRERIANIKSSIDTRPPVPQPHLTLYGRDYVAKKRATTEAAFADLKMIQSIARTMTRKHEPEERKGPASLNADGRKADIMRIMKENHKLLHNIENVAPMMRTSDLIREHRFKQQYVINASHTMRLSGGYEEEISRIRRDTALERSEQLRRTESLKRMRNTTGSVSLPSLSPNGHRGLNTPPSQSSSSHQASANNMRSSSSPNLEVSSQQQENIDSFECVPGGTFEELIQQTPREQEESVGNEATCQEHAAEATTEKALEDNVVEGPDTNIVS